MVSARENPHFGQVMVDLVCAIMGVGVIIFYSVFLFIEWPVT